MVLMSIFYVIMGAVVLRREWHRYDSSETWWDAKAYCKKYHIDLVTVENQSENQQIKSYGWIGLYQHDSHWRWSRGNLIANYTPWDGGAPQNSDCCVCKWYGDNVWQCIQCNYQYPFYCVDERLVLVRENKTWEEALEHCRALRVSVTSEHYDLAELITDHDYQQAQYMLRDTSVDTVWIGLRYLGDQWTWINGQIYNDVWSSCPDYDRCGVLERNVTMNRTMCHSKNYFLCSKIPEI